MRQLFDKTTKKLKKKAGKAMALLQSPPQQSRSASPTPLQQAGDPAGLAVNAELQPSELTAVAAGVQLATASISVATDSSQQAESAASEPAPPPANVVTPAIPEYAKTPSPPTVMETTGSAVKGLLKAVRDGSDLILPLKAALVGVVALWDIFDASPPNLL